MQRPASASDREPNSNNTTVVEAVSLQRRRRAALGQGHFLRTLPSLSLLHLLSERSDQTCLITRAAPQGFLEASEPHYAEVCEGGRERRRADRPKGFIHCTGGRGRSGGSVRQAIRELALSEEE